MVGTTASCSDAGGPAPKIPAPSALERREVWAHAVPQGLPLADGDDVAYGSERPLSFAPRDTPYDTLVADQVDQARAAGLTGMQILLLEGVNSGGDFVGDWMTAADRTWEGPQPRGFSVAPCLLVSSPRSARELVEQYAEAAARHPSAARSGSALVVWIYNARSLTPEQWDSVRTGLREGGTEVFLVAELTTQASQHGDRLDTSVVDPYARCFDAVWLFEDKETQVLEDFTAWAADKGVPFAGGSLPGYDRETSHGGYVDARGTELWRAHLEKQLAANPTWLTAVTWNDAVEHTSVQPTSDWGTTRADLLAHYSAVFRGVGQADGDSRAYVTTPQYLVAGQELLAEGLAINHGSTPVTVHLRVTSAGGRVLAESTSRPAGPGSVTTAAVEEALPLKGGDHAFAVVELLDESGRHLSSTRSAPVVVLDAGDPAVPTPDRRRYYSVSSHGAADFAALAELQHGGGPNPSGTRVKSKDSVRCLELLHNTWPAGLALDAAEVAYTNPPAKIVGDQQVTTVRSGFTVARLVTHEGKIAYSPPVHHPASAR
ncbi:hypothetical protein [Kocuria tytonicola]|uniref:hypothetical protein n=1 Tax=Kocuria tytonicola TaxID=2055946 RepID=UPI000F51ADB0|nr:hypothetical protein [Kocuria tytonicola]